MATDQSGDRAPECPEHAQCEKLERLEREYVRMTLNQNQAQVLLVWGQVLLVWRDWRGSTSG